MGNLHIVVILVEGMWGCVDGVRPIKGSINVGVIKGGERYNRVPDYCEVYIDRRLVPGETQEGARREIMDIIEKLKKERIPNLKAEVKVTLPNWVSPAPEDVKWDIMPYYIKPSETIVKLLKNAYTQVLNEEPILYVEPAYTEAEKLYHGLGIPTVIFGPGRMELGHSSVEFLEISQLMNATKVFAVVNIYATKI